MIRVEGLFIRWHLRRLRSSYQSVARCAGPMWLLFAEKAVRGWPFTPRTGLSPDRPWSPRPTPVQHRGSLRQVSWIDPAFTNFNLLGFPVNDDHPPADIKDGEDLVLVIYDALAASPQWDRSLLVIVYDENGGSYDHVPPPAAADD